MHHRIVRAAVVTAGLVAGVGGSAALADAASSSKTAKPSATPPAARSAKPHNRANCPNMGGDSSSGASYGAPGGGSPQPSV